MQIGRLAPAQWVTGPFSRLTWLRRLDFGSRPHRRDGVDPGHRLSRQRARLLWGENDIGSAFPDVKQATALADASRDFKAGLAIMRIDGEGLHRRAGRQIRSRPSTRRRQAPQESRYDREFDRAGRDADDIDRARPRRSPPAKAISTTWRRSRKTSASPRQRACAALLDAGGAVDRIIIDRADLGGRRGRHRNS